MPFATIPEVIAAIAAGKMVVLVDDEDRENEGDLVMAAEHANNAAIAFMATRGCGLICLAMEGAMIDRLGLALMSRDNRTKLATAFTLSIDAAEGIHTGISAADRVRTIQAAISDHAKPADVVSPGHIFPLRARDGGVLVRTGHSEASVDLARMAGCKPAAVICEIMKPDGTMARLPDLIPYCKEHGLLLATIADLVAWREARERLIELVGQGPLDTEFGRFHAYAYRNQLSDEHHLALVRGERLAPERVVDDPILVRVQHETVLGDLMPSVGLPGAQAVRAALAQVAQAGEGVVLCMREASGSRLVAQLEHLGGSALGGAKRQASLHMDNRQYGIGAQILRHLGVRRLRLISRSGTSFTALSGYGMEIVEQVPPTPLSAGVV